MDQALPMETTLERISIKPLVHRDCHQLPKPHMGAPCPFSQSLRVDGEGRPAVVERRQVEDGLAGCGSPGRGIGRARCASTPWTTR